MSYGCKIDRNKNMKKKEKTDDFRCRGHNKKSRTCNQLLFRYEVNGDEVTIIVKCPSCNNFNIFTIKLTQNNHDS